MAYGTRWGGYDQPDEASELDTTMAIPRNRGHRTSTPHAGAPEHTFRPPAARTGTGAPSAALVAKQPQQSGSRITKPTKQATVKAPAQPLATATLGDSGQIVGAQASTTVTNPQMQTVMESIQAMMKHMTSVESRINTQFEQVHLRMDNQMDIVHAFRAKTRGQYGSTDPDYTGEVHT